MSIMTDWLLTQDEISELTGKRQAEKQKAVLRMNGIPFVDTGDGLSVVRETVAPALLRKLGASGESVINLDAIEKFRAA